MQRPIYQETAWISKEMYSQERGGRLAPAQLSAGRLCIARMIECPEAVLPDDDMAVDYLVQLTRVPGRIRKTLAFAMPELAKLTFRHIPPPESSVPPGQETHHIRRKGGELVYRPSNMLEDFGAALVTMGTYVPPTVPPIEQGYLLPASHRLDEDFAQTLTEALREPSAT